MDFLFEGLYFMGEGGDFVAEGIETDEIIWVYEAHILVYYFCLFAHLDESFIKLNTILILINFVLFAYCLNTL